MPDITTEILKSTEPYSPSAIEALMDYEQETIYLRSPDLESWWTKNEINTNLLSWVKAGVLLDRVCITRAYKDKFKDWQDFCENAIYKSKQMVRRTINAAKIVMVLVKAGFQILPSCISQAERLQRYFEPEADSLQTTLIEKWQQVIDRLPVRSINANSIDEELGHMKKNRKRITIDPETDKRLDNIALNRETSTSKAEVIEELIEEYENSRDPLFSLPEALKKRIVAVAKREGISIVEAMEKYLDAALPEDESEKSEDKEADEAIVDEVSDYQIQRWEADLEDLVTEHDRELSLVCLWFKLALGAVSSLVPIASG